MDNSVIIRQASEGDIDFIVEAIVGAEKSGTTRFGFANLFGLTEPEAKQVIAKMLKEETTGCEYSLNSFLVAEKDSSVLAAIAGWIEGVGGDDLPSSVLKASLLSYVMPIENLRNLQKKRHILQGVSIERLHGAYQIEYVYVAPDARGMHLAGQIIERHIQRGLLLDEHLDRVQVQVFANNKKAMEVYQKLGFQIADRRTSEEADAEECLPDKTKLLLEKYL